MSELRDIIGALLSRWRHLGVLETDLGLAIGKQIDRGSHAYLHVLPSPLRELEIEELQSGLSVNLPQAYKELLTISNGPRFFGLLSSLSGRRMLGRTGDIDALTWQPSDLAQNNTFNVHSRQTNSLFFTAGLGNIYYYIYQDGSVSGIDGEGMVLFKWLSLAEWFKDEVLRVEALHGRDGCLRFKDNDPELLPPWRRGSSK